VFRLSVGNSVLDFVVVGEGDSVVDHCGNLLFFCTLIIARSVEDVKHFFKKN
jgi:hypothetical protein